MVGFRGSAATVCRLLVLLSLPTAVLHHAAWAAESPGTMATGTPPSLELRFARSDSPEGEFGVLSNRGSAAVHARVVARNGGVVRRVPGHSSAAARLPAFAGAKGGSRAVVRVRNAGTTEQLSPGRQRFEFGVEFALDRRSRGTRFDNGDNLVQRGRHKDAAQLKLQVERRRPSCVVKGSRARVAVTSPVRADPGRWYRVRCERDAGGVSLSVTRLRPDGSSPTVTTATGQDPGRLAFSRATPLSIGGKLSQSGRIAVSSDQFNGVLDNVYLSIG